MQKMPETITTLRFLVLHATYRGYVGPNAKAAEKAIAKNQMEEMLRNAVT